MMPQWHLVRILRFCSILSNIFIFVRFVQPIVFKNVRWEPLAKVNISTFVPSGRVDGCDQFIARVRVDGNTYHAQYVHKTRRGIPSLIYGIKGKEHKITDVADLQRANVDILYYHMGALQWILVEGSGVPMSLMIPGGYIPVSQEIAYICRIYVNSGPNDVFTGSYRDAEGQCFGYHNGKRTNDTNHEVLVLSPVGRAINVSIPSVKKV